MARTYPTVITANSVGDSSKFNNETVLQLQHLLGFTLDGVDLHTITSPLELHDLTERVAPSTPSSGKIALYADSADGWVKTKNDAGRINYWGEGAYTQKITLGANGEFNITLSDYLESAGATSMIIDFRLRSVTVATNQFLQLRLNGELPTTNYHRQSGGAGDGAALIGENPDQIIDFIPAASSPANSWQRGSIYIYNLEAGDVHVVQVSSAGLHATANIRNNLMAFVWSNVAAITSLNIRAFSSTDLASGSWIKLRFIKEAY